MKMVVLGRLLKRIDEIYSITIYIHINISKFKFYIAKKTKYHLDNYLYTFLLVLTDK